MKKLGLYIAMLCIGCSAHANNPCLASNFSPVVPPPPASNSLEIERLKLMVGARTPEAIAIVESQSDDPTPHFWKLAGLDSGKHTNLAAMIASAQSIAKLEVMKVKEKYNRKRPSHEDSSLTTLLPVPWHSAYPSGHATQAFVTAHVFAAAFPDKASDFFILASQVALGREIAGIHYSTDTDTGIMLADQIWKAIPDTCKPRLVE